VPVESGATTKVGIRGKRKSLPGERPTGFLLQIKLVAYLGLLVSGEVLLGEVLSEGFAESIGLVESDGFAESAGGAAMLPEEPRSPLLVSLVSVLVALDEEPSAAFLCFLEVVVDEVSPLMAVDESVFALSLGRAVLSVLLVVVVCWSIELEGLLLSCARAPKAVKPRASAVIAMYFMHISLWTVWCPKKLSTQVRNATDGRALASLQIRRRSWSHNRKCAWRSGS